MTSYLDNWRQMINGNLQRFQSASVKTKVHLLLTLHGNFAENRLNDYRFRYADSRVTSEITVTSDRSHRITERSFIKYDHDDQNA
jgi:hypothetical protein